MKPRINQECQLENNSNNTREKIRI